MTSDNDLHNIIQDPDKSYSKHIPNIKIRQNIKKKYENRFFNKRKSLDESNKLFIYKNLKKEYVPEKYLTETCQ